MVQPGKPFKRLIQQLGPYALSIAAIAVVLWYLKRTEILGELDLHTVQWQYFALVLLAEAVTFALLGLFTATFVAQDGISLRFVEWYGLAVTSNISNLIVPISGGMVVRAGYLKARYNFPVSRFAALFAAGYLIIFLVGGFSGLVVLGLLSLSQGRSVSWAVVGLLACMASLPVIVIKLPLERLRLPGNGWIMRQARTALEGWREIRTDYPLLAKQVVITATLQIVQASSIYFGLLGLRRPVPFAEALLIGILVNLTNFVRIIPGALGVREAVAGIASELVGFNAAQGISAALITRLAKWSVAFVLGPIFAFALARHAQGPRGAASANEEQLGDENQHGTDSPR